ncbi:hypothetical protein [Nocardia nova]|uniref:Uncharacterized protein n=1 Tax=Nocardia nova SH22a TaxID=1415166 RepID=W5TJV0_9NOCA|nr:hypothetical protein [Nocardia nova]AHH17521.1 hypothetical protein NONO_c27290 [Nocardia nova SH22a]
MTQQEDGRSETEGRESASLVVMRRRREVLDHFGSCPACGYATHAFLVTTSYADGRTVVTTEGVCGLPCGWSGVIEIERMTTGGRRS